MLTIDGLDIFQSLVSGKQIRVYTPPEKKQDNNGTSKKGEPDQKQMPVKDRHAINIKD